MDLPLRHWPAWKRSPLIGGESERGGAGGRGREGVEERTRRHLRRVDSGRRDFDVIASARPSGCSAAARVSDVLSPDWPPALPRGEV